MLGQYREEAGKSLNIYILDGAESIFDISFEIRYLGGPLKLNPLKFWIPQ